MGRVEWTFISLLVASGASFSERCERSHGLLPVVGLTLEIKQDWPYGCYKGLGVLHERECVLNGGHIQTRIGRERAERRPRWSLPALQPIASSEDRIGGHSVVVAFECVVGVHGAGKFQSSVSLHDGLVSNVVLAWHSVWRAIHL